ncbi:MAG: RNA pyrophosphohydrolase [Holosporaceae bacterium]|jgi:putative (di)nucleoside polyphosphate hydrolase|nr:RNA pyrophosphohydrolase [Holosporaceae bacterium]
MKQKKYRRCSAIFLLRGNLVFVGERVDIQGAWQIPQGGAEDSEEHFDAAIRELYEETGVKSIKFIKCTRGVYRYDFPEKPKKALDYSGQQVKFFAFEFIGSDSEINLQISEHREFTAWKWMPLNKLLNSIVGFKKEAFSAAIQELALVVT